jgi:transcriptional regulator with PAS, ATPase and Fis domain
MRELQEQIQQAACSDSNTLVIGETGTGKELVANAIHEHSRFFRGPFIAKHCGQITSGLAEAALFGYAPKSGISEAKLEGSPGWFEQANHGILFLDEIQTATGSIQDMFLRVLEDKTVCRFGARQSTPLDLKVVAATSEMDLNKAVEDGAFRAALYYRFRSKVYLPPLRERKEDIPLLAYYFLDKYARKAQAKTRTISHAALAILLHYDWPGNVRELEGIIEHAIGRDKEVLFSWDFNPSIRRRSPESKLVALDEPLRLGETGTKVHIQGQEFKTMERVEHEKILEALEVTHGNVTKAAEILGYKSRQTLLTKMDKFKIPRSYADPKG